MIVLIIWYHKCWDIFEGLLIKKKKRRREYETSGDMTWIRLILGPCGVWGSGYES